MRTDQLATAAIVAIFVATISLTTNLFLSTKSARASAPIDQLRKAKDTLARHVQAKRISSGLLD
jgi:hypothetical protein